jgi:hypothetical protein
MSNPKTSSLLSSLPSAFLISIFVASFTTSLSADVISPNVSVDIQEPAGTYDTGAPTLLNMRVKTVIGTGACGPGVNDGCTLNDVLNDIDSSDDFTPEIKVHMTADDFPDDGLVSNAKLRQRGATSRLAPQKSFRVKLDSKNDLWRDERRIQLTKGFWDFSRIRNKLSYDLFTEIPHLPSMRTQFVNFVIEDQGVAEDYGLYTHVENFGKEYLVRRGWDKDSGVYKSENFFYKDSPAFALDAAGAPLDSDAFEKIIEIKRGDDHTKFVQMIKDLNNPSLDFETQVFNKYYNRDNYLTWFAVNILLDNFDTHFHNYYLYNPLGTESFYIVPWDYDLSLGTLFDTGYNTRDDLPRWNLSQANWWGQELHKQFLRQPGNLDLLKDAVLEIKDKYLTAAKIQQKADSYYDVVFPVVTSSPDFERIYLPGDTDPEVIASYNNVFNDLANRVETNYARFLEHSGDPMPFVLEDPVALNGSINFEWSDSESITGQIISYDLDIATSLAFESGSIVQSITGISDTQYNLNWTHPAGDYYYRVIARDANAPQQYWQVGYNEIIEDITVYGVVKFTADAGRQPPTEGTSNPVLVDAINIDGNSSDWAGLDLFPNDPDDIAGGASNVIDWNNVGIAHDSQSMYLIYQNRGSINPGTATGSSIPWGWQAFMDTDNNPNTGFRISDAIGADYLLEGRTIHRYTGTGLGWSWQSVASAESRYSGSTEEMKLSRSLLGNPQSMRVLFQGANEVFGGDTIDIYPDGAFNTQSNLRYFSYSFGTVTNPGNNAPVAANKSVSVVKNTATNIILNATDPDGDTLVLEIVSQPTHGTLSIPSSTLFVQYTPDQNYVGEDTFTFRVNDGLDNSNVATVALNVIEDNTGNGISNPVISGAITINGNRTDWNNLTLFSDDPDDVSGGAANSINWLRAGLAHSKDTVYLMYENHGQVNPANGSGDSLPWGWQTYLDTDSNIDTGYRLNGTTGVDYLVEGRYIFQYVGTGTNWNWVNLGAASVSYNNTIAELSFPRSLLGSLSTIKVAFLGNNAAVGGTSTDEYPDSENFEYFFGAGAFGTTASVTNAQRGLLKSPKSHQPTLSNTGSGGVVSSSGGGSVSWLMLLSPLLLLNGRVRRRKMMLMK